VLLSESGQGILHLIPCDGLFTSGQLIDNPVSNLFFLFWGEVLPLDLDKFSGFLYSHKVVDLSGMDSSLEHVLVLGREFGSGGNSDKGKQLVEFHFLFWFCFGFLIIICPQISV